MILPLKISNLNNELLDVLIEGNDKSDTTIIFVHGFATDKHETAKYFDDIADCLKDRYRIIRFDLSGCGRSQGRLEEKDYLTWSQDLTTIINYVKKTFPGSINILAQSMGCFVTTLTNLNNIKKTIFTGLPNSNTQFIIDRLIDRFGSRPNAKIDINNISIVPRSTGLNQSIGPSFWSVLKNLKPLIEIEKLAKQTQLLVIHPLQDEIIGNKYLDEYTQIPNITFKKINGNHSFTDPKDRRNLINEILNFFNI